MSEESQRKDVFHIKEVGENKVWTRIGSAFVNKDGSLNAYLNTLPIDGKIHIRNPRPKNTKGEVL